MNYSFRLPLSCLLVPILVHGLFAQSEQRIRRVEEGLRLPVQVVDQPPRRMLIQERMRFYGVPGVSIAVIDVISRKYSRYRIQAIPNYTLALRPQPKSDRVVPVQ